MSIKIAIGTAAILAVIAGQAVASPRHHLKTTHLRHSVRTIPQLSLPAHVLDQDIGGIAPRVQSPEAFPTDYLTNRFGDFQLQGR
jgi:hypothetical protein